jgi:diguanylate cyclase (GGDEF)-like protein
MKDHKQLEKEIRIERDKLKSIFEAMQDGVYIVNSNFDIQYVNPILVNDFGIYNDRKCYEYFHDKKEMCSWCKISDVFEGKTVRWEWYSDKNHKTYDLIDTPIKNTDGSISKLEIFRDITAYKQTENSLKEQHKYLQSIVDGVDGPVMVIKKDYRVELMNKALSETIEDKYIADPKHPKCYEISHFRSTPCDGVDHLCPLKAVIETKKASIVIHNHHKIDGSNHFIELSATPLFDNDQNCIGIIESAKDITSQLAVQDKLLEQKNSLAYQAHHDALTGLPNRILFKDRLEQCIAKAKYNRKKLALFIIDLDSFKEINDSFGHNVGDEILKVVTQRLTELLHGKNTLARLGGDEFTIALEDLIHGQDASLLAEKLLKIIAKPITINDNLLYVSSSIGISLYPDDGYSVIDLLKYADAAMYKAKDEGRNNYQYYSAEMTELAFERVVMETNLRTALKKEEFVVYYQPQVNGTNGKLIGLEALVRWQHPVMGLVSPAKFIPLAETTGLIIELDQIVMRTAMKQVAKWYNQGLNPGKLALNLAIKQLQQKDFVTILEKIIKATGCKPEWIELEVTEGQIMTNPDKAITILNQINNMGIGLAIDDFGTGYSSLSYLKRLPIHKLKIDQSFIRELPYNEEDTAITKAVIALAKSLGLSLIAEGVEKEDQKDFLVNNGCENIQGYYYSRPVPAEEMEIYLNKEQLKSRKNK